MTVTPFRVPLISDPKALYDCLVACHGTASDRPSFVSLSLPLPKVDPLAALEALGSEKAHFYWEHPTAETAVMAVQPVAELRFNGRDRFTEAQRFIAKTLRHTISVGETSLPLAGPHFFCGFTFFERPHAEAQRFPAATVFLPQWQVACVRGQGVFVANLRVDAVSNFQQLTDLAWQTWQRLHHPWDVQSADSGNDFGNGSGNGSGNDFGNNSIAEASALTLALGSESQHQNRFLRSASAILEEIRRGHLEKLVLAETLEVTTLQPLSRAATLHKLRSRYADCQTFSMQDNQGQSFIGASPERLLQVQERWLTADALAGSAPRGKTLPEDARLGQQLLESTKDIHEHEVVRSFIQKRLQQLGVNPQSISPAHLFQLPNIQHLRTLVSAKLPATLPVLEVLAALHPTPAVAGTPQGRVEDYLRGYEPFDRHLYAAPLGWVDAQGNGHFTVGIRSALVQGNQVRLYAGAGIVAGSNPQKEWAEVQLKLQTLRQALVSSDRALRHG
ncbi:MAG: isochorismate synthase [Thermosynechococcaceae cyanobacterium MS004]|nr:isochorismate synthase [Thermosynechococcaceae cyanobacterium MS004]